MRLSALALAFCLCAAPALAAERTLLNVSYDPTRELYEDIDKAFAEAWAKDHPGDTVTVSMSHGGSGAQARSVIDGLGADVVTLALAADIDAIARKGLLPEGWRDRLPEASTPYRSTIVFLVRSGNPKGIHDWGDLVKDGVEVITPNPKTSGGARWNYLAAYGWALDANGGDKAKAEDYMRQLFAHVPVLDTGARGATTTFARRRQGDVLLAWENEAYLAMDAFGGGGRAGFEIVKPSVSILAEPPVAVVDSNVAKHGNGDLADAYLRFLYTPAAQKLIARHYYRPLDAAAADPADIARLGELKTFKLEDKFGSWAAVQAEHFADGGVFDRITAK